MAVALISSYFVYQVMAKQTQESLGRGLEVTLTEGIRILSFELENSSIASHGAVTRPFLISALSQLSLDSPNSTALQALKKNIDSLPEAGFSAAVVYDANNNQLFSVGALVNSTDTSLTLNNAADNGKTLIFNPSERKIYLRIEEFVLNAAGHRIGKLKTERPLNELTRSIIRMTSIGRSGEFMLCEPLANNRLEMRCLLSRDNGIEFKQLMRNFNGIPLPMSLALNGDSGLRSIKDYRQVPVISAYRSLSEHDLGVQLKIDQEEVYRSSSEALPDFIKYLILLITAGCIAVYLLVLPIARKLVKSEKSSLTAITQLEQSESHLRKLIGYQESIREEERRRIAGDIHDQLGGDLTGISSHLSVAISSNSKLGLMPNKNLESALSIVSSAMKTVRMTINELRLPMLDNFGIWAALRWYSSEIEDRSELSCEFVIDQLSELTEIDPDLTTAIFRIVQEATTNVIRHANASMVTIQVRVRDGELVVEVLDDGIGMTTDQSSKLNSMGLAGMRERARYLGGRLEVTSTPGEGTRVALLIPLGGGITQNSYSSNSYSHAEQLQISGLDKDKGHLLMSVKRIRVLLVDDHTIVRNGIRMMLETIPDIEIAGEAASVAETLLLVQQQSFDVVLLDIELPDGSGLDLLKILHKNHPEIAVLMLSTYSEDIYKETALRYGAAGYFTKGSSLETLVSAIHTVAE
jgi:signal transduction histidine kinase/ActR/RegA family two-component response regulator